MHFDGSLVLSRLTLLAASLGLAGCFTSIPPAPIDGPLFVSEVGSTPIVFDGSAIDNTVSSDSQADRIAPDASQTDGWAPTPASWDGSTPILDGPMDLPRPESTTDDTANQRSDSTANDGELDVPQNSPPDAPVANDAVRDVSATGTGGGTGTGGVVNTGGTMGSGGTTSTGGAGTGGTAGASGATGSGGATTSGGAISTGGTMNTGGLTGTGGATSVGGATGLGGTTITGGATSTGGITSTGGVTNSGGATGGTIDPAAIVPTLDGYLWVSPASASGTASGVSYPDYDVNGTCPNATAAFATQGMFQSVVHNVGGTTGTQYTINFELRGVLGTDCYTGGSTTATGNTQPTLAANPEVANNGWYMGGSPIASKWSTYEIHVKPAVGTMYLNPADNTENVYYLNAFPQNPSGWCSKEGTFPMNYKASFAVMGGGTITLTMHDSNCLQQQNCGPIGVVGVCANAWRTVDISDMPQPATSTVLASMTQPYKQIVGSSTWYPQWALFAVRSVTTP